MKDNFDKASLFVLKQEVEPGHEDDGSLHTDPADPGGTTRFGISQRAYPHIDLTKLDRAGAMKIYHEIWEESHCDDLPWPMDIIIFDTAFNMGADRAKKLHNLAGNNPASYLIHRQLVYYYMKKKIYFRDWIKRTIDLALEVL